MACMFFVSDLVHPVIMVYMHALSNILFQHFILHVPLWAC